MNIFQYPKSLIFDYKCLISPEKQKSFSDKHMSVIDIEFGC